MSFLLPGIALTMRRGSALLAVLVLVTIGSLVGTTVLLAVDAQIQSSDTSLDADQARALAWSGVQAAMGELSEQREDLLAGLRPELTDEWVLFTDDLGREGVVRLLVLDGETGEVAQGESGKLDINHATSEMLAGLEPIDETLADAIVDGRPYSSVEELLGVEGVSAAMLYGDASEEGSTGGSLAGIGGQSEMSEVDLYALGGTRLIDLLTVFSFEPNVQAALDDPTHRGKLRLNFDVEWSDGLADAVADRFGDDAVTPVEQLFAQGTSFSSDADLCRLLERISPANYELWGLALDALTTYDDEFRLGRVDINAASAEVLACLPGVDADLAEQLVATRESLGEDERQYVVWPLIQGVMTSEQFIEAVDWISVRSLQYRVRIEAGWRRTGGDGSEFDIGGPAVSVGVGVGGMGAMSDEPLEHRMVVEAVIDVASSLPRIAYLRDVTMLGVARAIASESEGIMESLSSEFDRFADDPFEALLGEDPYAEIGLGDEPGSDRAAYGDADDPLDGQERGAGDRRDAESRVDPLDDPSADPRGDPASSGGDDPSLEGDEGASGGGNGEESVGDQVMEDRRIGRWTSRRAAR